MKNVLFVVAADQFSPGVHFGDVEQGRSLRCIVTAALFQQKGNEFLHGGREILSWSV